MNLNDEAVLGCLFIAKEAVKKNMARSFEFNVSASVLRSFLESYQALDYAINCLLGDELESEAGIHAAKAHSLEVMAAMNEQAASFEKRMTSLLEKLEAAEKRLSDDSGFW